MLCLRIISAAKIGVLSIKSQIVSLIQKYKFSTNMKLSDIESNLNFDVDLRNEAGFHMRMQKRNLGTRDESEIG